MITSLANDQVKSIRKLRDRKYREETGKYFVEGTRIVFEAVKQSEEIILVIYASALVRSETGLELIKEVIERGINHLEVSPDVFLSISSKEGSQGIGAVLKQRWTLLEQITNGFVGVWIALNEISDPGNLGSIIRTIDAVGAKGLILIGNCTDPYDPTALRANMGALFSVKFVKTNKEQFLQFAIDNKINVIGTDDSALTNYRAITYPKDMILLMGSEREGLDPVLESVCQSMVKIPMMGNCDSLNLSVATGIVLYEVFNQHQIR